MTNENQPTLEQMLLDLSGETEILKNLGKSKSIEEQSNLYDIAAQMISQEKNGENHERVIKELTRDPIPEDRILETVPLYVIPTAVGLVIGDTANYLAEFHRDKHCHLMKQLFLRWNEADAELKYVLLSLSTNKDCTKYLSTK